LTSGSTTEIDLSQNSSTLSKKSVERPGGYSLIPPRGAIQPIPSTIEKMTIGPLETCGIWSVSAQGDKGVSVDAPLIEVACNLASKTESDLRTPEDLMKYEKPLPLTAAWFSRPIWFYLVALAWLVAAVEWFLYQRRYLS
jgi:hypothetical protein